MFWRTFSRGGSFSWSSDVLYWYFLKFYPAARFNAISGFNESRPETSHKTFPSLWITWHKCNSIYVIDFCGIVSGFNDVVPINKAELNRLRQVFYFDFHIKCSGSVTFWFGSGSIDPYHWIIVRVQIRILLSSSAVFKFSLFLIIVEQVKSQSSKIKSY